MIRYLNVVAMLIIHAAFVSASMGQIAPCGGSCSSGTAPICIVSPSASVFVITACVNGDLEIEVHPGAGQTAAVSIQARLPNIVFNDIKVRNPVAGTAVALSVTSTGAGSISSIRSISQSGGAGALWISLVEAGSIGSGGVQAASIDTVRALSGNIAGPIAATGQNEM